jgi:hypothetical protein
MNPTYLLHLGLGLGLGFLFSGRCLATSEDWTSARSKYDVHAVREDRFTLERTSKAMFGTARFQVQPGDRVRDWSGERSEVVLGGRSADFRVTGHEGTEYYRIAVRLSNDWKPPDPTRRGYKWGIFFQLHGPDEYAAPPAIAFSAENKFCLSLFGGDLAMRKGVTDYCLENSDLSVGKWVDFVLKVHWSNKADGRIVVYRRNAGENGWNEVLSLNSISTLQYRGPAALHTHYWKAGFYRSESSHTNTLWLGPIVRGRSFDQVAY